MYLLQSAQVVSRSTVVAPVNAPKYSVPVSTAIGAARSIVGVPTLPSIARTALGPRSSADVETAVLPAIGIALDGQRGDAVIVCASVNARAFASARLG